MRYKVWDMVKIKPLDEIRKLMAFNKWPGRNPSMTPMCWKVYEIKGINYSNYYRIYSERGTEWNFLEEWLESPITIALFI